ncbi:hypothetical protein KIW84_014376 [Lathyrus oleraceus]|uniref:ATP-dependent DNA helicase n=1 Tax=Pisum sativum TaxID=3888 RepID=A0A9D5BN04_PEA|nr:hypothetical protein KIW84_014376 [Pisum sativum]
MTMAKSRLSHPITCRHCNVRLFHRDLHDTCCTAGNVSFSRVNAPIELQQLFLDDSAEGKHFRDINVIHHDGNLKNIQEANGYYDPLQYPLLFPFETHGWDVNPPNCNGQRVSCRAYYSYMFQIHPNDQSMLLNAGRLLQQYVVDNYVKIESGRLRWIKEYQCDIRAELYQGLQNILHVGETNAENIEKRTIFSSSFIGGRRDMTQRYEDDMAIVINGGLTSWEYLLTNNGTTFNTFKKSVEGRGFLETGHSIRDCLVETTSLRMLYALRRLFVTILIFCEPTDVRGLWDELFTHMVEDYQTTNNVVESNLTNMLLKDLNELLNLHDKKIEDYDLPSLSPNTIDRDAIPRGIGKTFLYRTLMASLRSKGEIVLAAASSGIAATLLPGGRTAHSRFKIPIDIQLSSICGIQKQKYLGNLIRVVAAIIWDEAPMTNKNCLEALDRSLQDICSNNAPFGGKVLIMGGRFLSSSSCCKKKY